MDALPQSVSLFITHVDKEGPFLKVWGQTEKNNSIYVEQFLLSASQQFDQGIGCLPVESLQVNTLVCAKYKDNKYYRSRILNIIAPYFVEVYFLDYGNKDIVPSENIRSLQSFPTSFISIPPLSTAFIIAEAHCPGGGEWKEQIFDLISKELNYREVQCHLLTKATNQYLVKLFIENTDLGSLFINRGLLQPIPLHAQQAVLLSMSLLNKVAPVPVAPIAPPAEINTYKACTLEPLQQYAVYVSFVNEGPTHFSVQLQQSETVLAKLMKEINEIALRMMEEVPLPGTICLAKCQEDDNVCRAVVTNEVDNQFKVFYVDFGNYETLPFECLFQIPFKYVLPKVMAIRVALNGVEKSSVTIDMRLAFKKFVDNRLLHMKVLPSTTKTVIPKCELWDPQTKTSALDVINRAAQHAYPEPLLLNRGFTQPVKVSYVFSCNRFHVQLLSKDQELAKLMDDLQISCQTSDAIFDIKIGLPCCALFESDQLWYRSEIVDVIDHENVKVKYIDYGNEEVIAIAHLRMIEGELLTVLRPQAIECCLNGYQNMDIDVNRDALFEHLILEQKFTMKVTEMHGKKALVELFDENNYNVASLLLEKIAASKSQVSPMLVQADNTLQHRKSSDSTDNYRSQKKPAARECNRNDMTETRNDKSKKTWRTDNKDTRENELNSNDRSPESESWRQNSKSFDSSDRNKVRDRGDGDRGDRGDRRARDWSDRGEKHWGDQGDRDRDERGTRERGDRVDRNRDRADRFDRNRGDRGQSDPIQNDRSNVKERFNRPRSDKRNDNRSNNWNNKDDVFENAPSWDSQVNEPKASEADGWGDSTSPVQNSHEKYYSRDDTISGRRKFENRDNRQDAKSWNNKDKFKKDGFKKSFNREGSELSSSGSEKSFRKGFKANSKFEQADGSGGKMFQNRSEKSYGTNNWNSDEVIVPIDAAPNTATFEQLNVVGSEAAVVISWFHNPEYFYCQMQSTQPEFKILMEEIQQFYKGRKPESSVVGAPVIGLFPEDNVLYRGQVLEVLGNQYKILYVDFGNVSTINKVWPIDKNFMQMPAQAICCSLAGIDPIDGNWPDPSTFSEYFGQEYFIVRFLEKNENRTLIELWDNQNEVSQLLIKSNLAVAVTPQLAESIDISLLLGQQFRVVLKSVNNLNDIIVALECGLALTCKAHNLELASESHEDVLKAYLEQTLIVYVDNVLENDQLEVTFYDNEGNKIDILSPDEGAYNNVEPLCPPLIISSQLKGFVSHANETSVFIQPKIHADQILILLEQMYEAYENGTEETAIIPEEGYVYAVHSSDSNWYRGKVDVFDDHQATVTYVDYGNTESVPFSELRVLTSEFNAPSIMCLKVMITSGSALCFLEKHVEASIYYGETGWEGTIQESIEYQNADQPIAEYDNTDVSSANPEISQQHTLDCEIIQEVNSLALKADDVNEVADQNVITEEIETVVSTPLKGIPVYVSHIDTPTEFYVQFVESRAAIDELQQHLQQQAEEMPALENPSVGILCAAPYSVDHLWYRAEVLDADEDITTVRFVDFGNTDVINNKTTQVKTLPPNLLTLTVYATRCSLKLKPLEEEWNQQALTLFENFAMQENLAAEFLIQDEKTTILELYSNGTNVKDELLALNYAVPCEIISETKTTCFVSHFNSPSEFWVQMENCINELEWIAEQLSGAEHFPELDDMAPGTLCAALFPDDEMWYRARILSNTIAGVELLFIDYGNSCISNSLRQLPEDIVVTPPLAQKCCLRKPDGIPYWTKETQQKFAEISAEGQTIFELKKINSGETSTVELILNGENIVPKLLPVTQDGCLKNYQSLNSFDLDKNGELLVDKVCLEPLPGMEWDEESNKKFLQIYPESSLFQVELIGEDCVRLYQNGADIRVGLGGVKSNSKLLQVQSEKSDDLSVTKDGLIDYNAGGDNLEAIHSMEGANQNNPSVISEESSEVSSAKCHSACKNESQNLSLDNFNDENSKTVENSNASSHVDSAEEAEKPGIINPPTDKILFAADESKVALQDIEKDLVQKTEVSVDSENHPCSVLEKENLEVIPPKDKTCITTEDNTVLQNIDKVDNISRENELRQINEVNADSANHSGSESASKAQKPVCDPPNYETDLVKEDNTVLQNIDKIDNIISKENEILEINEVNADSANHSGSELASKAQKSVCNPPNYETHLVKEDNTVMQNIDKVNIISKETETLRIEEVNADCASHSRSEPASKVEKPDCDLHSETTDSTTDNKTAMQDIAQPDNISGEDESLRTNQLKADCYVNSDHGLTTDAGKQVVDPSIENTQKTDVSSEDKTARPSIEKVDKTKKSRNLTTKEAKQENEQPDTGSINDMNGEVSVETSKEAGVLSSKNSHAELKRPEKQSTTTQNKPTRSRPTSVDRFPINHDDKIIPACASRPQSPLPSDDEATVEMPTSRPSSSEGCRISHDEKILPAVLSRPQTPLLNESNDEN